MNIKSGPWRLSDLIPNTSGKQFQQLISTLEHDVSVIQARRNELIRKISFETFHQLLTKIEIISENISILNSFAQLRYYADTSSNEAAAFLTRIEKLSSDISNKLIFFDLWFKKSLDEESAHRLINSSHKQYQDFLTHKRLMAKYSLSEPEEKIITSMEVTGTNALVKIYDCSTNSFEFEFYKGRGKKKIKKLYKNKEKLLSLVRSHRPDDRESAYRALWKPYEKYRGVLGDVYQNIAIQWYDENIILRGFKSPISVRNVSNNLDDSTVDILLSVCKNNSKLFQDYFVEKAKMIGMRKLRRYDLYAPLSHKSQRQFKYENAMEIILKTFNDFDPTFKNYIKRLLVEDHIDSEIRIGKVGGAFCYTVSPKRTPYVLLNFDGRTRDVSTMAHEFGHAIHSMAASDKSILVSHAPLPLAETASVFAEMLLNDKLTVDLNKQERQILFTEQIDDMYATTIRQAYFTLFEVNAHHSIAEKNITIDEVCDMYLQNLREQFGDSLSIPEQFKYEWLYIPHFYHTPFYCYAYSFGNLLVLSLYQQYKKEGKSFIPKYIRILSSGGSEKPEKLLMAEEIDISKESFWQQGFDLIQEKIEVLKDNHKSNI